MSKCRIELNRAGVRELLQSPEIEQVCLDQANRLGNMCGAGTKVNTYVGRTRVNAMIKGKNVKNALEAVIK